MKLIIYLKKIGAEDLFVELYCEEVKDPQSTPCPPCKDRCQHTETGGKISFMQFLVSAQSCNI